MRKWREIHYPYPISSRIVAFCRKMLNTAILSRMTQKTKHTRYEEIILGRIRCEEAPQVVPAWCNSSKMDNMEVDIERRGI